MSKITNIDEVVFCSGLNTNSTPVQFGENVFKIGELSLDRRIVTTYEDGLQITEYTFKKCKDLATRTPTGGRP